MVIPCLLIPRLHASPVALYNVTTVTSRERYGVSNNWQLNCLLIACSGIQQRNTKAALYWSFVRGTIGDRWIPHTGPVTLKDVYIDGLEQERNNPIANALELRLSCTNPSICTSMYKYNLSTPLMPTPPLGMEFYPADARVYSVDRTLFFS